MLSALLAQHSPLPEEGSFYGFIEKMARMSLTTVVLACLVCTLMRVAYTSYLTAEDKFHFNKALFWLPATVVAGLCIYWGITQHPICFILLLAPGAFAYFATSGRPDTAARIMNDLFDAVVYAGIVVFLLIRPYGIQTFRIPTESMVPGLQVGDVVIVDKFSYRFLREPAFQDRVVFKPPMRGLQLAGITDPNTDYVKRCIGLPGDIIEIRNGMLYRNNALVTEDYVRKEAGVGGELIRPINGNFKLVTYKGKLIPLLKMQLEPTNSFSAPEYAVDPADEEKLWDMPAEKVPPGYFLMIGDNRNESADGRFWGLVPRENIVGRVWFKMFSPTGVGLSKKTEG